VYARFQTVNNAILFIPVRNGSLLPYVHSPASCELAQFIKKKLLTLLVSLFINSFVAESVRVGCSPNLIYTDVSKGDFLFETLSELISPKYTVKVKANI
jgi:hypothetical protein